VIQDAADTNGGAFFWFTTFSAAPATFSVFAKMDEVPFINLAETASAGGTLRRSWFDIQNGTLGTINAAHTAKIEDYGNGWYRCSITFTATAGSYSTLAYLSGADNSSNAVVSKGSYFWGVNLTATSYPQSYIPTLSTSVTRVADAASKTGISSLIGQTEGTLFCEFFYNEQNNTPNGIDKSVMRVQSGGGFDNEIAILYFGDEGSTYGKTIQSLISNGGVVQSSLKTTQTMVTGYYKVALAYKANDFALAVNGLIVDTDNSGTVPTCANFSLNESTRIQSDINPKQALLFKTRLSNSDLAALTA
jgi:hypothetical protein